MTKADQEAVKKKIAAIALAESYAGQEKDIAWIYYNRWKLQGEKGLKASVAYRDKGLWYKVWMVALGDTTFAKDKATYGDPKSYQNIGEYVEKHGWFKKVGQARANKVKAIIEEVFKNPSASPYERWLGQGNLSDFNIETGKWKQARQYFYLQQAKKVKQHYVKELPAGKSRDYSFLFHEVAIQKYFKENPGDLPAKVPIYAPK